MASFWNFSSNSINSMFSGLNGNNNTSSFLANYAQIRNGSYLKLAKAYYAKDGNKKAVKDQDVKTQKEVSKKMNQIKSSADELSKASDVLLAKGTKSVFQKKEVVDKDGNKTKTYDVDTIYKAVSDFADKYNDVIEKAGESNSSSVLTAGVSMVKAATANSKLLSQIGVTVGSDNKLSVDEETFKKADMKKVESLFSGNGSFAYGIKANASFASVSAANAVAKKGTYASNGTYNSAYHSASAFEDLI